MHKQLPPVSIVTPVYNGESSLRKCIESVLAQTYPNWDYTIVNNCSTDGTLDIAMEYAANDPRIRVVTNESHVRVIENYNNAVRQISSGSMYCKVIAADDWIYPECLERMVKLAEENPSVAIVGAYGYGFNGTHIVWDGLPITSTVVSGKEICRATLLGGPYVFGTPTSLLFRADIVRSRHAFFNEDNFHADTEVCYEFLEDNDFGFVHQVLTYSHVADESLTSFSKKLNTYIPGNLYIIVRHGNKYLSEAELKTLCADKLRTYYDFLARQLFRRRGSDFWKYHRDKLESLGFPLSNYRIGVSVIAYMLDHLLNPKRSLEIVFEGLKMSSRK